MELCTSSRACKRKKGKIQKNTSSRGRHPPENQHESTTTVQRKPFPLDQKQQKESLVNHESPLGGKLEGCFVPSVVNRMNLILLRLDQSPFHRARFFSTSSWVKSGAQNPVLNSLFSISVRCDNASSLLLGGRPFRRSCRSCSISGTLLLINLLKSDRISTSSTLRT